MIGEVPPCRIRPMGGFDIKPAAIIHDEAFGFEAWGEKSIAEVMAMPRAAGLMAVDSRKGDFAPLGFLLYLAVAEDAELLTVAVRPTATRRGIGTTLIEAFFAAARRIGAQQVLLEVADDNIPAQRLYHRLGFTESGRRPDYYSRPGNKRVGARLLRLVLPRNSIGLPRY